uniref:NADH-ubiquinone oxidoreductase chain 4L n=1 Tax=Hypocassida subferruginea TaxID=1425620 RepID=A0A1P8NM53_9CUCU|nr:NADH dehydrogenase subunit 4L [Hypocassida subferruginea]
MVIIMYLSGVFVFLFSFNHFLFILLSLEFIMLSIFLSLYSLFTFNLMNIFFSMIYLTMAVCEGVLGLSVMVSIVRSSGNDNLLSLTSLW